MDERMMTSELRRHGIKVQRARLRIFPTLILQIASACHPLALCHVSQISQ